jgi:integrase
MSSALIAELVQVYLADQRHELLPDTFADRRRVCARFAGAFGSEAAGALHPSAVKSWILSIAEWKAPTTRWGVLNVLKRLFNWAVEDRQILYNPIDKLRLPLGEPRRPTSEGEFQAMLRVSTAIFRRVLTFMRSTGCRPQDVRVLDWPMVHLDTGIVVIPKGLHKTGRKTGKDRVIVLTEVAWRLLKWLRRRATGEGPVFLNKWRTRWSRVALARRLSDIRKATGIDPAATLHGIRHLVGSTAIRQGGSIKLTSHGLGHSSSAVTEKFYIQLGVNPNEVEAIRAVMELGAKRNLPT